MIHGEATAEVFLKAVKGLPGDERRAVIEMMVHDRLLRRIIEDTMDIMMIEEERNKPSRPLREYIEEREGKEKARRTKAAK